MSLGVLFRERPPQPPVWCWKINLIFAIFNRLAMIIDSRFGLVILSIWQKFWWQKIVYRRKEELSKNDSCSTSKMESINCASSLPFFFLSLFRGVDFPNLFKKACTWEKIGYSWKEWEQKIACHCGRAFGWKQWIIKYWNAQTET